MSNVFTLDALREETIRRYAPTEVHLGDGDTVEMKSVMRLREKDRKTVVELLDELSDLSDDDDEEDTEWAESITEVCSKIIRLVASSPKKLIAALDHDDPQIKANLFTAVLSRWIGETQVGEAQPSPTS